MKLVYAIVNNDDTYAVNKGLQKAGIRATKLSSTGGFLMAGNTTFMIGTEDDKVDEAVEVISKHSKRRTQMAPSSAMYGVGVYSSLPVEVTVGGATIFVLNVERFEKI